MKHLPRMLLLTIGMLFTSALRAQETTESDRFRFYTGCRPILAVVEFEQNARGGRPIALTTTEVRRAVTSRLRAARLYAESAGVVLEVEVQTSGAAYSLNAYFLKPVRDLHSGIANRLAPTWRHTGMGTHGNSPGAVVGQVAATLDYFIDEYLRINADSC